MKKAAASELGSVEEVLRLYNTAVEPLLGMTTALTQTTKGQVLMNVREITPQITCLVNSLNTMLEDLRGLANNGANRIRVDAEYPKVLRGFVCCMMTQQHLNSGNICPRSRSDLNQELKFYNDNIADPDAQEFSAIQI